MHEVFIIKEKGGNKKERKKKTSWKIWATT